MEKRIFDVKLFNLENGKQKKEYTKLKTEAMNKESLHMVDTPFEKRIENSVSDPDGSVTKDVRTERWVQCDIVHHIKKIKKKKKSF